MHTGSPDRGRPPEGSGESGAGPRDTEGTRRQDDAVLKKTEFLSHKKRRKASEHRDPPINLKRVITFNN